MSELHGVEPQEQNDVLVIEADASTIHVRPVRGCSGVYAVIAGGAYLGGFRCDEPSEAVIRDEAELVIEEARSVAEL